MIGSTGLVGSKIASLAENYGFEAYSTGNTRQTRTERFSKLDITDQKATGRLIRQIRPATVINAAALTNVDYCESHREEAERVNVTGVRHIAEAANEVRARVIHISTDTVFDGERGQYSENDLPNPINFYSRTKLESEKIVSRLSNYAIARPSVVYGYHSSPPSDGDGPTKALNFAMFVLDRIQRGDTVRAVTDQYSSPTFADSLAEGLLKLSSLSENGIFHTAGRSCVNRYEFAIKLARIFGYPVELVRPVLSSELKQSARRPKNCCLKVVKAETLLKTRFSTISQGIERMKDQIQSDSNADTR